MAVFSGCGYGILLLRAKSSALRDALLRASLSLQHHRARERVALQKERTVKKGKVIEPNLTPA